ncbi:hypothetical protein FISHEDRAFT_39769 [Fistulina hepatica ATCC 64428]|uniref:Uncharacterized protein n=1 Tax=Fistulina hepatica ATCC 64428 TaxID=1128425 RepID=A0A0D7AFX8_9AGAR|nr:hypothetical protein FISHEDRAFT_39769 [Fistulina hepatica ATCC 64428]
MQRRAYSKKGADDAHLAVSNDVNRDSHRCGHDKDGHDHTNACEHGHHEHADHGHKHSHAHAPSIFHTHSHEDHSDSENLMTALEKGDKGSRITLVGLFANVALTVCKGAAGWYLHSASLLAEAGHSASDLLGDLATLLCWRTSRQAPTERYPFGFAKFETLGTCTVSMLLIAGALGIGFHSYNLLIDALTETATHMPVGPIQDILVNVTSVAPAAPMFDDHGHAHVHVDPNAAWFAALSVITKEWLFRMTKRVADEEHSSVLLANAYHHKSDVYSGLVSLFAILGTWMWPSIPLDPCGGLLVSLVILRQGGILLYGAWGDMTDAGVSLQTRTALQQSLDPLLRAPTSSSMPLLLGIHDVRARRAGSVMFVDLTAQVAASATVSETHTLEKQITQTIKDARRDVREVTVSFKPVDTTHKDP